MCKFSKGMDHLEEILNSPSNVVFFSLDRQYRYLIFNKNHSDTMRYIWGVDIEKGVCMFDYILKEEDREKAKINFDRALSGESFTKVEAYGDEAHHRLYYEDFYSPLKNGQDEIIGLTVFVTDITERRRSEIAIANREQMLDAITSNIREGIYRATKDHVHYVNDAFLWQFGISDIEELRQIDIRDLYVNQEDRKRLFYTAQQKGLLTNESVKYKKKDGTEFWGLLSAKRNISADGEEYFDGAIRDITAQKNTEKWLKDQVAVTGLIMGIAMKYLNIRLEDIEDEIQKSLVLIGEFCEADRVYIFDINDEKKTCSNTYEWVSEGTKAEIDSCQNVPLAIMGDAMKYEEGQPLVIQDTRMVEQEQYRKFLLDQEIKSILSVPSMDNGQFVGFVGIDYVKRHHTPSESDKLILSLFAEIMVSIRNRQSQHSERQKLLDTATHQNERLMNFSFITSHNIRSSVTNLMSLVNIQKNSPSNPEVIRMLDISVNKLHDTLENINELLHFEHDLEKMKKTKCDLHETVQHALEQLVRPIMEKGARIKNMVSDDVFVQGYPAFLDSILYNLISNALKYGLTDERKMILISNEVEGDQVIISVQDFGDGMDLDMYGKELFKLGSRFHPEKEQGQGLGLFMTKRQVEVMGGKIEVESELQKGTVFHVSLKLDSGKDSSQGE
jgi:PAS domain S-box-containing protein